MDKNKKYLLVALLIALVLRVGYVLTLEDKLFFPDSFRFHQIGISLAEGRGFGPSAFTAPLYPLFLSGIYRLFGDSHLIVRIIQSLIGVASVWLVFLLGRALFSEKVGLTASLITAFYPFFIFYTGLKLTETLFIFLLALAMLCLLKAAKSPHSKNFVLAGIFLGLSSLCRPIILAFPFFASIGMVVISKSKWLVTVRNIAILFLFFAATIAPWTIRNYLVFCRFVPGTTMGGLVLFAGNNPLNRSGGGIEGVDFVLPQEAHALGEYERDRFLRHKAIEFIKAYPGRFFELAGIKFLRFWRLYLYAPQFSALRYRIISLLSYGLLLPFFVFGIILSLKGWRKCLFLYLIIFHFTLVHMVFIASIRYRVPIMPYAIILAAYSLQELGKKLRIKVFKVGAS